MQGSMTNWFNKIMYKWARGILEQCFGQGQLQSLKRVLSLVDGKDSIGLDSFWDIVTIGVNALLPFGIALVTLYFLMHIFDAAAKEQITVDALIKVLIQLTIVVAILSNIEAVINGILSFGESVYRAVSSGVNGADSLGVGEDGSMTPNVEKMLDTWFSNGEDGGATIFLQSLLIWLVHQIAIIAIDFAAISRLLSLGYKIVITPIAVANCFEGGVSSPAIKHLKSVAADALGGAAIWITAVVGFSVSGSMLIDENGSLLLAQAALFATAGACIGINAKVKESLG